MAVRPSLRTVLITEYLDYVNNYLSMELWAEHHGMTLDQAQAALALGKQLHESPHPEA